MKFRYLFRSLLLTSVLAVGTPAIAGDAFSTGDSYGPAGKNAHTEHTGAPRIVTAAAALSWASLPWVPGSGYVAGYVDPTPASVKQIIAESDAAALLTYNSIAEAGGCNADFITFYIASYCHRAAFGSGPHGQMGSQGN